MALWLVGAGRGVTIRVNAVVLRDALLHMLVTETWCWLAEPAREAMIE